jgi:hypothetical protein
MFYLYLLISLNLILIGVYFTARLRDNKQLDRCLQEALAVHAGADPLCGRPVVDCAGLLVLRYRLTNLQ